MGGRSAGVTETVEYPLEGGGHLLVRVDDAGGVGGVGSSVVTRGGRVEASLERAESTFEAALGTIEVVADGVLGKLAALAQAPSEVRVEFGLELTARAGAILAAAGTTAQLTVGLTWRPGDHRTGAGPEDG
jgi:NTP-dependent ternary system trypsin peptidase co-occuring protein